MKNSDLLQQDLSLLVKSGLCNRKDYQGGYLRALQALKHMKVRFDRGEMAFLRGPFLPLTDLNTLQENFRGIRMILVVGSPSKLISLRALSGILQSWIWVDGSRPRLCFLDDLDPEVFWEIMSIANPLTTGVMVLSQSGESEPVLLQLMRCLEYWHGMMEPEEIARHFVIITSPSSSRLMRLVERWKLPWWRYPVVPFPALGCFSPSLLAPLGLAGFDRERFNQGSGSTCLQFFQGQLKAPLEMAAVAFAGHKSYTLETHRVWGHGSIFHAITAWMQEVAQQLRKKSPYACVSSDQKIEGKRMTTMFFERHVARERLVPDFWKDIPALKTLAQTPMLHWVKAKHERLCHQEMQEGHFLRRLNVHSLNEETLGALFMNHVLETLLVDTMYEEWEE